MGNDRYELVVTSTMELAIVSEDMRILFRKKATAAWEQLEISEIFSGSALHVPLFEFGAIPPAARLYLSSTFTTVPIRSIRYLAEAVRDRTDGLDSITLRHHICNAARWEMSLRVLEGLVSDFAAREGVSSLDESFIVAFCNFD